MTEFEEYVWRVGWQLSIRRICELTGRSREDVVQAYDAAFLENQRSGFANHVATVKGSWSEGETQQLYELRGEGATFHEIAFILGRTEGSCRLKYYSNPNAERKAMEWDEDEVSRMLEMRKDGMTFREIGEKLGRGMDACKVKCRKVLHERSKREN